MVQNLRAYFIRYVVAINRIICVQEKSELSSMLQRLRLNSSKISGGPSLATEIKQQ